MATGNSCAALTPVSGSMSSVLSKSKFAGYDFSAASCIDSIFWAGAASAAVSSSCHTSKAERNPWLSVVLADAAFVSRVVIYNRADCCQQHLGTYQVWVGDSSGDPSNLSGMTKCQPADVL